MGAQFKGESDTAGMYSAQKLELTNVPTMNKEKQIVGDLWGNASRKRVYREFSELRFKRGLDVFAGTN